MNSLNHSHLQQEYIGGSIYGKKGEEHWNLHLRTRSTTHLAMVNFASKLFLRLILILIFWDVLLFLKWKDLFSSVFLDS